MARGIRSDDRPDVTVTNVEVKHVTEKAMLVIKDGEEYWLPNSQIRDGGTVKKKGDKGTVVISAWIAGEKGLTGDDAGGEAEDDTGDVEDYSA